MKIEIKLDETTLPKDGQKVKWLNIDGIERQGVYIASEHMFAYSYDENIVHDWDFAHYVDSWEPLEDEFLKKIK